jgi:hypothetical protein
MLFLFISASDFQFAVVNKKAETAQEKNTMECRGSSITVQRKSSLQDQKWDLFHTKEEKWSVVAT